MPIRDTSAQDRPRTMVPSARRRQWLRRGALAIVALSTFGLIAVATWRWLSSERSISAARLRIAEVTRGTFVRDAAVNGRVVAAVSPTLYAPVPGTITLSIRAGDAVKKGDVLATMASPALANELDRERSTLAQLEAQLGSASISAAQQRLTARREADEAALALSAATRELAGADTAWHQGVIAEVEYLRARDAVEAARVRDRHAQGVADLAGKSASFAVKTGQQQYERQRLAVADLERRVDELTIRAPVGGVVGTVSVADRALVAADTPLMTLVDLSRLEVELEVPETYADDLGLGMTVEVQVGAATATGTLSALSPEVVKNQVLVRVRFAGAQPAGLRQSQRVSARILIEERPDVLMLPRGPFIEAQGGRYAYVLDGEVATRRAIRLGVASSSSIEILDGLRAGERVVIAGSEDVGDAATIRIND